MAKKHSTGTAVGKGSRKVKKDCFDYHWCDPRNAADARENFLAYCALLDRGAVSVKRLLVDLLRAGSEMPTLQSIALPEIVRDSVFSDIEGSLGVESATALKGPVERLLNLLPDTIDAVRELDQEIFTLVERLTGGPGARDSELTAFVLQQTQLKTLEQRTRGDWTEEAALETTTHTGRDDSKISSQHLGLPGIC